MNRPGLRQAEPEPARLPAPTRSSLSIASAFLGLFVGGAALGLGLARLLAPESWWAEALSAFALPTAFALGLKAWFGLALLSLALLVVRRLVSAEKRSARLRAGAPIPGAAVFVPIASAIGAAVGVVVGWLSTTHSVWLVAPVYWLVGTCYGLLTWRLARAGLLQPPEST